MTQTLRPSALVALGLVWLTSAAAQVPDHLKCYKVKDTLKKFAATADLDTPDLGLDPGCRISQTKYLCVPVTATNVSGTDRSGVITPLPVSGSDPGTRICYRVKCDAAVADQVAADQFGIRTFTKLKASLVCTPAVRDPSCPISDTRSCYGGPAGTAGLGTCQAGTQTCDATSAGAAWGPCQGEVAPVPGDCAHASCTGPNDPNPGCACIDGGAQGCYTGPAGTADVGPCHPGFETCSGGVFGPCEEQQVPVAETCNGVDDDCDGVVDDVPGGCIPVAMPTVTASGLGVPISPPPAGYAATLQVDALDTVTFHGHATDPDGDTAFTYRWRLISAPPSSTAALSGAPGSTPTDISTQTNPTLFAQLVGDYVVGVVATDAMSDSSDEARVLVRVKPQSGLLLELVWDRSVDMDIQLARGAATPFTVVPGDADHCYWGNRTPDWGAELALDDLAGCRPEDISFGSAPVDSEYEVYAHVFCNHRGHLTSDVTNGSVCYEPTASSPVDATLKVYVDGSLVTTFVRSLVNGDVWHIATLRYEADGWHIVGTPNTVGSALECTDGSGDPSCVCGNATVDNTNDPYCGPNGTACRANFP